ncbi:MAG: hypothetical protein GX181_00865 [Synergistaceae bacterium]|nr:hypothetical protein [Synergistaceae bacterium]
MSACLAPGTLYFSMPFLAWIPAVKKWRIYLISVIRSARFITEGSRST